MKKLLTLFLLLVISTALFAQEKVTVIDFEKVINNSQVKKEFDYLYNEIDSFIFQLGREQITIHNDLMVKHKTICSSPDETKILKEAQERQRKIQLFEKFYTDTLPFFRQSLYNEVQKIIQTEIDEYKRDEGIEYIVDAKKQYFGITKIDDVTYFISFKLKQKYNSHSHKLLRRQAVFNAKERFKLNQDLRERFAYVLFNHSN